jgi:hypothetical protein
VRSCENPTFRKVGEDQGWGSRRALTMADERKVAEGKRHAQALIALARRRVNVVWAMLRDETTFETRSAA